MAVPTLRTSARRGGATAVIVAILVVLLLAGGGAYVAFFRDGARREATTELAAATKGSFEVTTTSSGELESRNKVELRSMLEREATIVRIVDEGTRVKAGDVVIELNTEDLQQQINEELLQVESVRAQLVAAENAYNIQLNENESKLREATLKVDLAELALSQWREGDATIKRQESTLAIERAGLELERLAEKYAKSQELLGAGFLSKDECDRDELAYIEAISKWNTSRLTLEVYDTYQYPRDEREKLSAVEEAKAALERVKLNNSSEITSKDAARKNQRQQLAIREQKLAKLQEQMASATIKAPQDGLVVYATSLERRFWGPGGDSGMQVGTRVYPNQLLAVLPDTSDMVATIRVQEAISARIKPGQEVSVRVDAAGGRTFQGKVESIGVLAESGGWRDPNLREYSVKVALDIGDAAAQLKPSMRVEARVVLGQVEDALSVPVQAVFQDGAVRYAYVSQGARYVKRPVKVGRRSDAKAEVLAGLGEGDRVLIRQPDAGEVIDRPWDDEELKVAGYEKNAAGQVVAVGGPPEGAGPRRGNRGQGGMANAKGGSREGDKPAPKADAEGAPAPKAEPAPPETKTTSNAAGEGASGTPSKE